MTSITGDHSMTSVVVPIPFEKPSPLPGHLAPLDRRHRWSYMKTTPTGDFRYRCRTCRKWKTVTPLMNLLAEKMRDAAHGLDRYLSEVLFH